MDFPAARDYILYQLEHELDQRLIYHSYTHTVDVYSAVTELSILEGLTEEDQRLVETAALYHDSGMLTGYDNHEESSALLASKILKQLDYSADQIEMIRKLILGTRLPQMVSSIHGMILCDADLDYLGRSDYFVNSFRLKLEWQFFDIIHYSLSNWFLTQEKFFQSHNYLTATAKKLRNEGKKQNLESIQALIQQGHKQINQALIWKQQTTPNSTTSC
ncbi:MAG: HD domain-containing protein [Bacteroidia bacterium]|nr:HD domain-containing protein [Bacteroidia bacterium]